MHTTSKKTTLVLWPDTISGPQKVVWEGRSFSKISGSSNYYAATFVIKGKPSRKLLHRLIWEKYNKKVIGKNEHIHHIDKNPLNNHPSNLQAIDKKKHRSDHLNELLIQKPGWWEKGISKAREEAKKWHASKEGKNWHSKHGKQTWACRDKITKKCFFCNQEFQTYWPQKGKYCSKKCGGKAWFLANEEKRKKYNENRRLKHLENTKNGQY